MYHVVQQGEHLAGIAHRFGFREFRTIYEHPENAEFPRKRPNPNQLYPGDRVYIPAIETKNHSCPTNKRHTFVLKQTGCLLRLRLADVRCKVLDGTPYTLTVGDQVFKGLTKQGVISHIIPAGVEMGLLVLDKLRMKYQLKIGHLDPAHDPAEDKPLVTSPLSRGFRLVCTISVFRGSS